LASGTATVIALVGMFVGLIGLGIGLFNSWEAVRWKRTELASNYMKEFNNTPELVFAGRCLDWNAGRLIVPESLREYLPNKESTIEHDRRIFARTDTTAIWRS
jgi:hypothetical protein